MGDFTSPTLGRWESRDRCHYVVPELGTLIAIEEEAEGCRLTLRTLTQSHEAVLAKTVVEVVEIADKAWRRLTEMASGAP